MSDLDELLDELLREEFDENPVQATALGVEGYDDRLGDLSASGFERRAARADEWCDRIEALGAAELGLHASIDRDLALSTLRGRRVMDDWQEWRRSPDAYLGPCLYGVFYLFLHRLHPEPELVDAAVARLDAVPAALEAGRANLRPELANPLLVRRSVGMCRAGVAYARELLPAEVDDRGLRARVAEAGERAANGFEAFAEHLDRLAEQARGEFAIGEERYSAILREQEGLAYGASELHERGRRAVEQLEAQMAEQARTIDGTDDFRSVIRAANRDRPDSPEAMLRLYTEWTGRARDFLVERELVTMPEGERCDVVPSPAFQRPVLAVASYMQPPAFTGSRVGHFFVPYPPEGASDDDVAERLAMNSRVIVPAVSVHEAYPGHHWHLAMAAGNPRPVRKVFGTSYFAEGWALYTEQMMREEGFFSDPRQELLQLDMRLWRAARIVVDTALHCGTMSPEEAGEYMRETAGLTEPVARSEVERYCAWPTQAASYLTGALEIERIRARYVEAGRGDLRTFHDTIAASGVLPLALAERAVMGG